MQIISLHVVLKSEKWTLEEMSNAVDDGVSGNLWNCVRYSNLSKMALLYFKSYNNNKCSRSAAGPQLLCLRWEYKTPELFKTRLTNVVILTDVCSGEDNTALMEYYGALLQHTGLI